MSILTNSLGITNASASDLSVISNAPIVRDVIVGWFRNLKLTQVIKLTVNFEVQETLKPIATMGMVQPLSGRRLEMKPEGQRTWDWILVHATPDLTLYVDDVIFYGPDKFRVMSQKPYTEYGFVEYELINDYVKKR